MGRLTTFVAGMVTGAALLSVATHYHIVRGKQGVVLVRKLESNLSDIYVDTRDFSPNDWLEHKAVALAILRSEKGDVFQDAAVDGFRDNVEELVSGWLDKPQRR